MGLRSSTGSAWHFCRAAEQETWVVLSPCVWADFIILSFPYPTKTLHTVIPWPLGSVGLISVSGLEFAHTWGHFLSKGSEFFIFLFHA